MATKDVKPANRITEAIELKILTLYDNKYYGCQLHPLRPVAAGEHDGISVSKSFLRALFLKAGILSPLATRKTRRWLKEQLEQKKKQATSKKERIAFKHRLPASKKDIRRRPRAAHPGELIQMDASVHVWFGGKKTYLHLAVDDCTGSIVGRLFRPFRKRCRAITTCSTG